MITQEELKAILHYDPNSGVFTRIKTGNEQNNVNNNGYIVIDVKGKKYRAHRLAWLYVYGSFPTKAIDHVNGVRANNRVSNLRELTSRENSANAKKHRSGSLVGANYDSSSGTWRSYFYIENKHAYIGRFPTEQEAHQQYMKCCNSENPKQYIDSWRVSRGLKPIWNHI